MNISQTKENLFRLLQSKDERDIHLAFQLIEENSLLQEIMEEILVEYKILFRDIFHVKKERITFEDILELKSISSLNFNYQAFRSIPPQIKYLNHLVELDFINNQIMELPVEIGELKSLEYLGLSSNRIKNIPSEIGDMIALKVLVLEQNQIQNLPAAIQNLKNLNALYLRYNAISIAEEQKIRAWLPHCKLYF